MDIIQILDSRIHLHLLNDVRGISETRIHRMKQSWDEERSKRDMTRWLSEHDISTALLPVILSTLGENAMTRILENPYLLAKIQEVSFGDVDRIAKEIGKESDDKTRLSALVYALLSNAEKYGSLALPLHKIETEVDKIFDNTKENKQLLYSIILSSEEFVHYRAPEETDKTKTLIYLRPIFESEVRIAQTLLSRLSENHHRLASDDFIQSSVTSVEDSIGFPFEDDQKQAITNALQLRVSNLTGGGGCGKTTIIGAINAIAKEIGINVINMTPTGASAKTLAEKTGFDASVVHATLGINSQIESIYKIEPKKLEASIIIIDELGLLDNGAMFQTMLAIRDNKDAHIVFVGDIQQNTSPGAGNVLVDLIRSGVIPTVHLKKIQRT